VRIELDDLSGPAAAQVGEARRRGYARLYLETGSMAFFEPARALYRGFGFVPCPPFGDYRADPYSVHMALSL
jgi:putative acetyltransferase